MAILYHFSWNLFNIQIFMSNTITKEIKRSIRYEGSWKDGKFNQRL